MLANINLTTKVFVTLLISILGMLIISIASYIGFSKIGSELEEIANYQVPINRSITELEASILKEGMLTYALFVESKDTNSSVFKTTSQKIKKLEESTDHLILQAEDLVQKAITHNTDAQTKATYESFYESLKVLEKEQKSFEKMLAKFEADLKNGHNEEIKKDKEEILKELQLMEKNIVSLMHQMEDLLEHSTHKAEQDEKTVLRIIEIIAVVALIISILSAFYLQKLIKNKFLIFQGAFVSFFEFLNRKNSDVLLADDKATDEFGEMSRVLNENVHRSKRMIEEEREVVNETIAVLAEFEQGDLSQRVQKSTNNPALTELIELLNQMGDNLERNISDILMILEQYSQNNYLNRVEVTGLKEHLLRLSTGINDLGEIITKSLQMRKRNASSLKNSANTLKLNVESLSTSSTEAAASLEETAAALEEITSTIISNADNVTAMANYAAKVTKASNNGEELAQDTMQAMDEIDQQVTSINEAITVIDQIAFQTNILSLNAAVEAATAGEAGKGFAVVAQEVRNLATRSADAAKEIKGIVEHATIKANSGKEIAQNMLGGYESLNADIEKTLELIKDVDSASKEQQAGIEQINDAVTQLDQQTQMNSAAALETSEIAVSTDKLSDTMLNNINANQFHGKEEAIDRRKQYVDLHYDGVEKRASNMPDDKQRDQSWESF